MTKGDIYTLAGDGHPGFAGDGGPAASAQLDDPNGVALDSAGNMVVADAANNRVRVVAATSGTFYGVPMTAGDIYTVAGTGAAGLSGDGGPGTSAELSWPSSVASDGGNLVIADSLNERIRLLSGSGLDSTSTMAAATTWTVSPGGRSATTAIGHLAAHGT